MKLSKYAKKNDISYITAYRHWKLGYIKGKQLQSGTIVVYNEQEKEYNSNRAVLYTRVSSSENKSNLISQLERVRSYAIAKGYNIVKEIKEIGSGLNDNRKQLASLLESDNWDILIVEHKDRLARFGINYMSLLLNRLGKKVEIINETDTAKDDLMQDFISIITSFSARIYGLRRSKRKTEKIIKELEKDNA